jgi:hypothetical protein
MPANEPKTFQFFQFAQPSKKLACSFTFIVDGSFLGVIVTRTAKGKRGVDYYCGQKDVACCAQTLYF